MDDIGLRDVVVFRDGGGETRTGFVCTLPGAMSSTLQVSCLEFQGLVAVPVENVLRVFKAEPE